MRTLRALLKRGAEREPKHATAAERAFKQQAADRLVLEHKREAWRWTDSQAFKRFKP